MIQIKLSLLELPDIEKYQNHWLFKKDIIPIGPDGRADMRYFAKKIRG